MKTIRTERLILRPFKESDYDDLCEFLSQPEADEFEGDPGITYENGRARLSERLGSDEYYAVELAATGKVIGNVSCLVRDFDAREVGYIVNRLYQRQGYGSEALSAVIAQAFCEGAHRVFAECDPRNAASRKLLEKVGLRREAHFRQNVRFCREESGAPRRKDTFVCAITAEEFSARRDPAKTERDRPVTTLFLLSSADGKISTGSSDELDFDRDLPRIDGVKEGLPQYYEIEQTTDLWSFNTGRVQAKIGANEKDFPPKTPVSFVLLDNSHLTERGVRYFCAKAKRLVLITSNRDHPAFHVKEDNLRVLFQERLSLRDAFASLKKDFGCERLTVQSGGTVNALLLREKLIDYVDLVIAPVLVGGKDTATAVDGPSLSSPDELSKLGVLKRIDCTPLENSYLRLRYEVIR
ncbi:MAG: GNAT family N-acetyltransferase [Clostridia bacterium]|nr:GNAT family N-acetyltransferase [Clostridia bacterium]